MKVILSFWGGLVDLLGFNNIMVVVDKDFIFEYYEGCNIWFGVCEFVMVLVMNGI